jgi:hypothetical protein
LIHGEKNRPRKKGYEQLKPPAAGVRTGQASTSARKGCFLEKKSKQLLMCNDHIWAGARRRISYAASHWPFRITCFGTELPLLHYGLIPLVQNIPGAAANRGKLIIETSYLVARQRRTAGVIAIGFPTHARKPHAHEHRSFDFVTPRARFYVTISSRACHPDGVDRSAPEAANRHGADRHCK